MFENDEGRKKIISLSVDDVGRYGSACAVCQMLTFSSMDSYMLPKIPLYPDDGISGHVGDVRILILVKTTHKAGNVDLAMCLDYLPQSGSRGAYGWPAEPHFPHFHHEMVRQTVSTCHKLHETCKEVQADMLPGLRVIDCQTRLVIPAPPSCQYVALSYV